MPAEVTIKKGEPVDRALKRLKNKLEAEGILEEVRRLRSFETPTQRSKRKARANAKRGRNRPRFMFRRDDAGSDGNNSGGSSSGGNSNSNSGGSSGYDDSDD